MILWEETETLIYHHWIGIFCCFKRKWYSERRRKPLCLSVYNHFPPTKRKWYSERRRKLNGAGGKWLLKKKLKGNDTLRGDGNFVVFFHISIILIKGNDTLRGDGNLKLLLPYHNYHKLKGNDTLRGDGNSKTSEVVINFLHSKRKWYSERRRKLDNFKNN